MQVNGNVARSFTVPCMLPIALPHAATALQRATPRNAYITAPPCPCTTHRQCCLSQPACLLPSFGADEPVKPFDQLDDESKRLLDAIQERQAYIQAGEPHADWLFGFRMEACLFTQLCRWFAVCR